jgi:Uma2 family endonuclease
MVARPPLILRPEDLAELQLWRFSSTKFKRILEIRLFDEDERVELLRGLLISVPPSKPPHAWTAARLNEALTSGVSHRAMVYNEAHFAASNEAMPQPDLFIAPEDEGDEYPSRAYLVVEIADDSTLAKDRRIKIPIYARAGVPEYWIVNLIEDGIEVYTQPQPDGTYASRAIVGRGGTVSPVQFPDIVIAVDYMLPHRG